ncbi:TatD family hydrolase [Candidatus Saccharibacteria bacterium]|nr:TatD family hydrolase [Candidatus Saccharibacteria bacterium]
MINFVDTHCHMHEADYALPKKEARARANAAGVTKIICVGTDVKTSQEAIRYANKTDDTWATIGLHPHDAKLGQKTYDALSTLLPEKSVVGIGECGLDFYYNYSSKKDQIAALEFQMQLALDNNLPMVFHVRDGFDDFWPVYDSFSGIRGVVHSFSASNKELKQVLKRDLYVGLNGIMTFTKDINQLEAAKIVPLEKLLLETDAPFLTPKPLRGTINESKNISVIGAFLAELRGEDLSELAYVTSANAQSLFGLK